MVITLKTKIWLIVSTIVLIFFFFTLIYIPNQQEKYYLSANNKEAENLAKTIAIGVKNAMNDEYYEGVKAALKLAKEDSRFKFVSLLNAVQGNPSQKFKTSVTVPEEAEPDTLKYPEGSIIAKLATFKTETNSAAVLLVFSTEEINRSIKKIRVTSLVVGGIVLLVGILIGFWFFRSISSPVLALREAARKVGRGDFTQRVINKSRDEIGELSNAFNNMVQGLANNEALKKANADLASLNNTLNSTIENLKATQAQLVQSEKMASLGELTAGIAHEIQNPLNFVNNFSEVNAELFGEMKNELNAGNIKGAIEIANTIQENELRITVHGKRADAIVKGMLQHSRTSTGQRELSDINALCSEYLRLAYQGFRSRDKLFNATLQTDFDGSIGNIYIVPQDILRVLLNIYNNAFYALSEKQKISSVGFEPMIAVRTIGYPGTVEISVRDNGMGIPQQVLDKIFQPFFTTKPTGQGTGLGLSLSYDIVKAHGGEIRVKTAQNEFTEFLIVLPRQQ